jgi:hypothetical protein
MSSSWSIKTSLMADSLDIKPDKKIFIYSSSHEFDNRSGRSTVPKGCCGVCKIDSSPTSLGQ